MKAESLSVGIAAIIKREEIRQSTDIDYIHDNLEAKQNKNTKWESLTQRDTRACQSKQLVNKVQNVLSR